MYNNELKLKFIREYTHSVSTANVCKTVFNAFEKYEDLWNADLCTQNTSTLQPVIDKIVGLRARSKWMQLIILKEYVKWCINVAKVPGACDGMLQITGGGLDKIRQQTVPSPLGLQKYLDIICDDESENTIDNIYRCYYWLAYGGVDEEDILSIKTSDVDFQNMIVRYKDTEIPVYREAIKAFKNCCELDIFVYKHPNYTKDILKPRAEGDTLVRGLRPIVSPKYIRVELSRRAKANEEKTNIKLSYFRARLSGIFYRTLEKEIAGETPDFSWIASTDMNGKTYKLDTGRNTMEAKQRQIAKDYMEDYQRWKLAFNR